MRRAAPSLLALWLLIPVPAPAQDAAELHASYDLYAAGFHVAEMDAAFGIGPHNYQVRLDYHTTGLVSLFHHGHSSTPCSEPGRPAGRSREQFQAVGVWQGEDKVTLMDYLHGQPLVRQPDPAAGTGTRAGAAVVAAELGGFAQRAGLADPPGDGYRTLRRLGCICSTATAPARSPRTPWARKTCCRTAVPSSAARRCAAISSARCWPGSCTRTAARTTAGRCTARPGSLAWCPARPPVPVQMQFETRWFGEATMYLTQVGEIPPTEVAVH